MGKKVGTSKMGMVRYLIEKWVATAMRENATAKYPDGGVKEVVFNFPEPKRGLASVLPNLFVVTAGSEATAEAAAEAATATAPEVAAPAASGAAPCEPEIVAAEDPDDESLDHAV
jgi:hypothetical protein